MKKRSLPYWVSVFHSDLGWMALLGTENGLKQLTFGHPSAQAAKNALDPASVALARVLPSNSKLVKRFQAFTQGAKDDFGDVELDWGAATDFQRRVWRRCRKIPYGATLSYGQLAVGAGSPRAARAVGLCMANNPLPLLVPCHRVVRNDGRLGNYSAPGGVLMKKRLLRLEKPI
jgi:methylated-DNA-[protein]-cysteine S-methyltransferase